MPLTKEREEVSFQARQEIEKIAKQAGVSIKIEPTDIAVKGSVYIGSFKFAEIRIFEAGRNILWAIVLEQNVINVLKLPHLNRVFKDDLTASDTAEWLEILKLKIEQSGMLISPGQKFGVHPGEKRFPTSPLKKTKPSFLKLVKSKYKMREK